MTKEEQLRIRIQELEQEVQEREKDLAVFRRELASANQRLETLLADLNQDLRLIHAIQKQMVPTEIPHIQGFEFSFKFVPSFIRGGDYFDIFEHEDRARFGIIVASSSGHTMSALLLSVLLKMTGQIEARKGPTPNVMLRKIADEIITSISETDTADLFYAVFDRRNFTLSYAKAGDIYAVHFDYAQNELKLLKTDTPVLTKTFSDEIKSYSATLNPRDKLILCTKGLVETKNLEGQEFGRDRLYKTILEFSTRGVHELRNQILFKVQQFAQGQELARDLTVVVAEVKDRIIKLAKN